MKVSPRRVQAGRAALPSRTGGHKVGDSNAFVLIVRLRNSSCICSAGCIVLQCSCAVQGLIHYQLTEATNATCELVASVIFGRTYLLLLNHAKTRTMCAVSLHGTNYHALYKVSTNNVALHYGIS